MSAGPRGSALPEEVPALPAFALQKAIATTIRDHEEDYWTGTVYSTNRRVWETGCGKTPTATAFRTTVNRGLLASS